MRVWGQLGADLALIGLATLLALAGRHDYVLTTEMLSNIAPYLMFSLVSAAFAIVFLNVHRGIWRLSGGKDYERVALVAVITVVGAVTLDFLFYRLVGVPRSLPLMQLGVIIPLLLLVRVMYRYLHNRRRSAPGSVVRLQGEARQSLVLIVGLNALTELYLQSVAETEDAQVEVVGILGRNARHVGRRVKALPVLGVPEDVDQVLKDLEIEGIHVDCIVLAIALHKLAPETQHALQGLQDCGRVTLLPLAEVYGLKREVGDARKASGYERHQAPYFDARELTLVHGRVFWSVKRMIDFACALVLLVVTLPLSLAVGVLVVIDVGAPVLFRQRRPGRYGQIIKIYKFRTMQRAYDEEGARVDDAERSSPIGRFLRRSRLDELPQLYNILIGDMSFVGPRPLLPIDQAPLFKARLLVRPGLTGWAQVEGGRIVNADDKAALDIWYVQNASLLLDLLIVLRTVPMLVFGERVDRDKIVSAWACVRAAGLLDQGASHAMPDMNDVNS
ncbi:MAG: sugar transferase [Hyphomicrobiaceae bacterium]